MQHRDKIVIQKAIAEMDVGLLPYQPGCGPVFFLYRRVPEDYNVHVNIDAGEVG